MASSFPIRLVPLTQVYPTCRDKDKFVSWKKIRSSNPSISLIVYTSTNTKFSSTPLTASRPSTFSSP
ncbi:hypothetical protein VTJ04DRAFT_4314 [Mycothermus thermophilus]|uniref:uncharacterized protein n=1 Tax=Humicola insolens TaxID=85995 RepID=UPI003742C018